MQGWDQRHVQGKVSLGLDTILNTTTKLKDTIEITDIVLDIENMKNEEKRLIEERSQVNTELAKLESEYNRLSGESEQ